MAWKNTWWNGGGGYADWSNYSGYFEKYESMFAINEKKREFKTAVKNKALELYTPVNVVVNDQPTHFYKKRRMSVSVKKGELTKYNKADIIEKMIKGYDKIPFNSDVIDNAIFKRHLNSSDDGVKTFLKDWVDVPTANNAIRSYFEDKITYKQMKDHFRVPTSKEKAQWSTQIANATPTKMGNMRSRQEVPKEIYNRTLKLIRSKIKLRDIVDTEENLRKGKRINRSFINKTSYKPLISKTVSSQKKKKLFVLIDASGSMWNKDCHPANEAWAFAAGLVDSWQFDVEHIIWHNTSWWTDVIGDVKKWKRDIYLGGGEWFSSLEDNIPSEFLEGVDYVLVLTDLCIDETSQQWLYDFIKHKKNMILSFERAWDLKGMNVRQIKEGKDMVNALGTLVS